MIKSLVFVTIMSVIHADNFLRTPSAPHFRALSLSKIAGYDPTTIVTDHNAIDLDQLAMEAQLSGGDTDAFFTAAKKIYEEGGNSKSYAVLKLTNVPMVRPREGDEVIGKNSAGVETKGKVLKDLPINLTSLQVQYQISEIQESWSSCRVGGLPTDDTWLSGCFADTGNITIAGNIAAYTRTDNKNARTLQYFSTSADTKMRHNEMISEAYYDDFQKFVNFYGTFEYSDRIIQAAFAKFSITLGGKELDFSNYRYNGRKHIIAKTSVYMGVAMYVIRELEDAIDDCKANDSNRNADGVNSVDEAAAFYTGSLERTDGNGVGVLVYDLSDKFCVDFKTCGVFGDDVKGTSKVNLEIFKQFNIIKAAVIDKLCDSAIKSKNEIVKQLFVPLIQGTLRTAQILSTQGADYEDRAEGAAAALAVLPMLHDCDSDAATIIFNNMKPSALVTDHAAVKKAIESTYGCLKISCPDVGGFYDFSGAKYFSGSEPCDSVKDSGVNVWLAVGISVGVLPILVISVVVIALMFVKRQKTSDPAPSVSPAAVPDRTTVAAEATSKE